MQCMISSLQSRMNDEWHSSLDDRVRMSATVELYGTPEEARELAHARQPLEIITARDEAQQAREAPIELKVGDQIKYQFIRPGRSTMETSIWMTIAKIGENTITANGSNHLGRFSFSILPCQVVEHKPKGFKGASRFLRGQKKYMTNDDAGDAADVANALQYAYATENTLADPLESLRRQVKDFNLV